MSDILDELMNVIENRKQNPSPKSYTTSLFAGGVERIGGKVTEEAAEVVEAASETGPEGKEHLVAEVADLTYHLLVLLSHRDLHLDDVRAVLSKRFGISGLEEKASRRTPPE